MAKYTTELRTLCEGYAYQKQGNEIPIPVETVIDTACEYIFDFDFPIWNEDYRHTLEKKIIFHYYTREIGEETENLFKFRLQSTLLEIMPYYNKLYESADMEFNPLRNYDLSRTGAYTDDGTAQGNSSGTGWNLFNDTPQGSLEEIDSNRYLTNATKNTAENSNDSASHLHRDYWENISGFTGVSGSKLLKEYRETILNIDLMVINALADCFFQLW